MNTRVSSFYQVGQTAYGLKLLAGEQGLDNSVSWIYLAEDIHNMDFLKGGEMVITTGLFLGNQVSLLTFVRSVSIKNCSCILLNIGKYIVSDLINEELLDFCNQNQLPLFTMP